MIASWLLGPDANAFILGYNMTFRVVFFLLRVAAALAVLSSLIIMVTAFVQASRPHAR